MPVAKVVSQFFDVDNIQDLDVFEKQGGYEAARKSLTEMDPSSITAVVKDSNLRGRGGAYFATGVKWGLMAKGSPLPNYLICNSDESEPCTFSDRWKMKSCPHQLIEGMIITAFAIQAHKSYIYMRGEFRDCQRIVDRAIAQAYEKGYLGKGIFGTDFDLDMQTHMGAGAYICGEESALIESLEGKRGFPRIKPPYFPPAKGLYMAPTTVNNCETLMNIPPIITKGADWFKTMGTEKAPGTRCFGISGHVNRPGPIELEMGTTLREIIEEHAGGVRGGKALKAVMPGGLSSGVLSAQELDTPMDPESLGKLGTMLGTGAVTVMDETTCIVRVVLRCAQFAREESCGQCTPCRDGTDWLERLMQRMESGEGQLNDIPLLMDVCHNITDGFRFRTICGMGVTDAFPVTTGLKYFKDEFEAHIAQRGCPFN
ncbi:MAG TPA: NADH-quinone oxidoreductase subunit NuoF [Armatimonadota bacterium]|nr:NADH-quinone oxidoreductase subunit NuoF [Armatimonadota bacterium]